MTRPSIEQHPDWIEHQKRLAALNEAAERKDRATSQAEAAAHEEDTIAWRAKVHEAALAGKKPPTRPAEPDHEAGIIRSRAFVAERDRLRAEGQRILAEICPEIEAQASAYWVEMAPHVQEAFAEVNRVKAELEAVLTTVVRVRRAEEAEASEVARPSRADRTRARLTLDELQIVAHARADLFEPTPVPMVESRIQRDAAEVVITVARKNPQGEKALGMTEIRPFQRVDPWPEQRPENASRGGYI